MFDLPYPARAKMKDRREIRLLTSNRMGRAPGLREQERIARGLAPVVDDLPEVEEPDRLRGLGLGAQVAEERQHLVGGQPDPRAEVGQLAHRRHESGLSAPASLVDPHAPEEPHLHVVPEAPLLELGVGPPCPDRCIAARYSSPSCPASTPTGKNRVIRPSAASSGDPSSTSRNWPIRGVNSSLG